MTAKRKTRGKPNRFEGLLDEVKDGKAGKARWETTLVEKDGTRTVLEESLPESRKREANSALLKSIRAELDLTQAEMAKALSQRPTLGGDQQHIGSGGDSLIDKFSFEFPKLIRKGFR